MKSIIVPWKNTSYSNFDRFLVAIEKLHRIFKLPKALFLIRPFIVSYVRTYVYLLDTIIDERVYAPAIVQTTYWVILVHILCITACLPYQVSVPYVNSHIRKFSYGHAYFSSTRKWQLEVNVSEKEQLAITAYLYDERKPPLPRRIYAYTNPIFAREEVKKTKKKKKKKPGGVVSYLKTCVWRRLFSLPFTSSRIICCLCVDGGFKHYERDLRERENVFWRRTARAGGKSK